MSGLISPYVGPHWGHFTDWVYWANWMGAVVAEEVGASEILHGLFPTVPGWIFALVIAIITMVINLYSARAFAETEYWLAFLKIAVIVILMLVGFWLLCTQIFHMGWGPGLGKMNTAVGFSPNGIQGILNSLLIVIYSYGGSELAALTVSEVEDPKKAIPKAIRSILLRIIAFYIIPIFLFLELLPWKDVSDPNGPSPFAEIFSLIHIPYAENVVMAIIVIALFSAINSAIYATSRSLFARVENSKRGLGAWLKKVSPHGVPTRTILFCSGMLFVGVVLSAVFGDNFFNYIAGSISYTISIVWIMLLVSALIMYFKDRESGSTFIKIVAVIALIALVLIFVGIVVGNPWGISVFALVIGLASFFSYRKPKKSDEMKGEISD
jgi:L-asparagine transporter-like permease